MSDIEYSVIKTDVIKSFDCSSFICKTLVISYDSTARFVLDLVRNTADSFSTNASHRPVAIMFLSGTHMFTATLVFLLPF